MASKSTTYAAKFGLNPNRETAVLGKSGLTLLDPYNPNLIQGSRDFRYKQWLQQYQRRTLFGYTSASLIDLDCISSRALRPSNPDCPIADVFIRNDWETRREVMEQRKKMNKVDGYLLGTTGQIDLLVTHPLIWNTMLPSLKLASLILYQLPNLPWFDDFLLAPREPVNLRRFTQDYIIHSKERRDGVEARSKMNQIIDDVLFPRLKFGFMSRFEDVDGSPQNNTTLGKTRLYRSGNLKIWLSLERVISLFRTDLSDSERYQEQWLIATILIHELTHAFRMAINNFDGLVFRGIPGGFASNFNAMEPFFEEKQTAELGFSISQALFGGVPVEVGRNVDVGGPTFVIFSRWFPTTIDPAENMPKLIPPPGETIVVPFLVTYFENVLSKDYWDTWEALMLQPRKSTAHREWIVATEFEAIRLARFDKNSQQSLSLLDPDQRKEYIRLMKADLTSTYQPLRASRNKLVGLIIDSLQLCTRLGSQDTNYIHQLTQLFGPGGLTETLVLRHTELVKLVPKLEAAAGSELPETRRDMYMFHFSFRAFLRQNRTPYLLSLGNDVQVLDLQLNSLWRLWLVTPFLQFPNSPTLAVPAIHNRAPYPISQALQDARNDRSRNDPFAFEARCWEIINNFTSASLERAQAMALLETRPGLPLGERINLLSKVLVIYTNNASQQHRLPDLREKIAQLQKQFDDETIGVSHP